MNKYYRNVFTIMLLCYSGNLCSQLKFDINSFNEKFETVEWLCVYDKIAWWTSDSVMAASADEIRKLGHEWFCYRKDGFWHAAYGKYENGNFIAIFHYTVDTNAQICRVYSSIDSTEANAYSRALIRTNDLMKPVTDSFSIRFNRYIKRNEDSTLSVWALPGISQNGDAIYYGGEFYFRFDRIGNRLLQKGHCFKGYFRRIEAGKPREIWLDYREYDKPTLGAIFFVWNFKKYFTNIFIENKKSHSTVFFDKNKREYYWTHIEDKE